MRILQFFYSTMNYWPKPILLIRYYFDVDVKANLVSLKNQILIHFDFDIANIFAATSANHRFLFLDLGLVPVCIRSR